MNRVETLRKFIQHDMPGLEIGPSHSPIAPKCEGYRVEIIDHMSAPDLKEKYAEHNVNLEAIEHVDYVWSGEPLSTIVAKANTYSWIIASHVIEHMPNILGFLNDCEKLLTENGYLILAIPDKRFCFDRFRPISGISKVLDAYYGQHKSHTAGTAVEYFLNVTKLNDTIAWGSDSTGNFNLVHTLENAKSSIVAINQQHQTLDLHAWVFTPSSFRLIIKDLNDLELCKLKEIEFIKTASHEFFMVLGKKGRTPDRPRIEYLKEIEQELSQQQL
jgi:hypothetical protein